VGPNVAGEVGPNVAGEVGPNVAGEVGPNVAGEVGPVPSGKDNRRFESAVSDETVSGLSWMPSGVAQPSAWHLACAFAESLDQAMVAVMSH
jgi:hypothetical protein